MPTQTAERPVIDHLSSSKEDFKRWEAQFAVASERVDSPEVYRETPDVLLAVETLDPKGHLRQRAEQLVAERRLANGNHVANQPDPMTDLLGGARMVHAFRESRSAAEIYEAEQNWRQDIRTMLTEGIQKGGHISPTTSEVNALGEATVGPIANHELFLRAAHIGSQEARALEITEEFLSAAHFNDEYLRDEFALFVVSPSRQDTPGNTLMARYIEFAQDPYLAWRRETQQLYVANSHTGDAKHVLEELSGCRLEHEGPLDILGTVLLLKKEKFPHGVSDIAQILDAITKDRTGGDVFCGIPVTKESPSEEYNSLFKVSLQREQELQQHTNQLALEALELAVSDLSYEQQRTNFIEMLMQHAREICRDHPEYAADAFGEYAAGKYKLAQELREAGDIAGAEAAEKEAYEASNSLTVCESELTVGMASVLSGVGGEAEKPKNSPRDSLEQKYGFENVRVADCLSCEAKRVKVGPCQFCNVCDTKDRIKPGYIKALMDAKTDSMQANFELPQGYSKDTKELQVTLRKGQSYRMGGEVYMYGEQVGVGGAEIVISTDSGAEIMGREAHALADALAMAQSRDRYALAA